MEGRNPGVGTRFGAEDLAAIPTRRAGLFDLIRATPGISPTSPSSGTINTISAFGSSTNENSFLIDGTDFTSPSNGAARADPGVDFMQEVHVQSVGASVEYGNVQGAVVNVVTRQGGNRFLYDASYYGQTASLTSQPIRLPVAGAGGLTSGYARAKYRDFTTNLGGPAVRDRLWFFAGYQYLRDYDSQPGTDPTLPRISEEDNIFGKLTWRLAPGWQLVQSVHNERWVNAEQPTIARPFETTLRFRGSVPAVTFAHLTHTWSANTVWDVRIGRFAFSQEDEPSTDNLDDAEPVRPGHETVQRRSATNRQREGHPDDRQSHAHPVSRRVTCRPRMEGGRTNRKRRPPIAASDPDGCEIHRRRGFAVSSRVERTLERRWRGDERRRIRERRRDSW